MDEREGGSAGERNVDRRVCLWCVHIKKHIYLAGRRRLLKGTAVSDSSTLLNLDGAPIS